MSKKFVHPARKPRKSITGSLDTVEAQKEAVNGTDKAKTAGKTSGKKSKSKAKN